MTPSDLSPEELDEAACRAVGIKGDLMVRGQWTYNDFPSEHRKAIWESWREEVQAEFINAEEFEVYPPVSSEPAPCAVLIAAAAAKNWIIRIEVRQFGCFAQVALPPHTNDPFIASPEVSTDDPEPWRAVALAVVASKRAQATWNRAQS